MPSLNVKASLILSLTLLLMSFGCSDPRKTLVSVDTGKHTTAQWSSPDNHGARAKAAPSTISGFAVCKECHGNTYAGGNSDVSCLRTAGCHGGSVNAPHAAAPWRGGTRTHIDTDPGNAPVCSECHSNGANSSMQPSTPAAVGTAAGCFNNTLCHGTIHAAGWNDPDNHGAAAKSAPSTTAGTGFSRCQSCHSTDFTGGSSQQTCLNTAGCHGLVSSPHPAKPWRGANSSNTSTRTHTDTDPGNASVCALCHTYGVNSSTQPLSPAAAGTAAGCFNNTLCHAAMGHAAGWATPAQHGVSAKNANGFSECTACHGNDFSGGSAGRSCLNTAGCHGAGINSPHPQKPWRNGPTTHTTTDASNAAICANCHTGGALMTSLPTPTNPAIGTPGCFNSTLCHGQVGHAVGWAAPAQHGASAKNTPNATNVTGFSTCQICHGNNFLGGTSTISCMNTAACHGAGVNSPHAQAPWISSVSSTMTHTTTNTANAAVCGLCHWSNRTPPTYVTPAPGTPNCYDNTLCHGNAASFTCVSCHTSVQTGTHGTPRDAVVAEFGLAWGHKKSGRGAVTDADCIVCHLEGKYSGAVGSAIVRTTYHRDGNIDLRDPDGAGETPITNISGGAFTFTKFATSYAAGSRTSTGHLSNNVDNVLTQKFCLACHDSNGATNPTARTSGGTAFMPWGGVNLGANYTIANDAAAAGGVIDVKSQFTTTNSSVHPLLGPRNSDYPVNTRLAAPYDNIGTTRVAGAHNLTNSVVLNCFDCHNTPTTPLTTRTVAAHGNAQTLRGTIYVSAAASTLCTTCHTGYTAAPGSAGFHGAGSAWAATGSSHDSRINCHECHGSGTTLARPARPLGAQDYHGNNALVGGGVWPTINSRPYAFIRGWSGTAYHRPYRSSEFGAGSATCGAGTCPNSAGGGQVADGTTTTYTPGGTY